MDYLTPFLASDVPVASGSSFRDLLAAARLSNVRRILDVGAGGFVGQTTTIHLLDLFPAAEIVGLELHEGRARTLDEALGDRVEVVAMALEDYLPTAPFDLIVVDLDTGRIPGIFDTLLPGPIARMLPPGGVVVSVIVTDLVGAFDPRNPKGFPPSSRQRIADPLLARFGTPTLSDAVLKSGFAEDPRYRAVASVDKFRGDPHNPVGWLMLQRR